MRTMTTEITFAQLNLAAPIQRALTEKQYTTPSPIQAQAIPHLLEGRDLMGCAQTGTGKTAAFALPILHRLAASNKASVARCPRVLILTPTRELAAQIGENFAAYGRHLNLRHTVIFGGVGQNPQERALNQGVDIVVATPGRLLDLRQQGCIDFKHVEVFVLDEADRMLDMGFAPDVKRIMGQLPSKRQSLLFSATMPPAIMAIADKLLRDPIKVEVTPVSSTVERIEQQVCHVTKSDKPALLIHTLREHPEGLVLVFSRTKHGANRIVKQLAAAGLRAEAIHGNKSQSARERALSLFRSGKIRILVATDIAARGIDVKGVALVINFDLPNEPEAYVHRIGRTARAGAEGKAIAFCDHEERPYLRDIEKLIREKVPVVDNHPFVSGGNNARPATRPFIRGGSTNHGAKPALAAAASTAVPAQRRRRPLHRMGFRNRG
jgi:ATP-dependent RNA helicase RhlE